MYRGTRKLVPLFYNTILQKAKMQRSESRTNLLELCRATQHFDDEISKCKGARAEQTCLSYAERRSISMMKFQNAKE